jgi:hypothetical protein
MSATTPADFDLRLKMAQIDAALASHDMMTDRFLGALP